MRCCALTKTGRIARSLNDQIDARRCFHLFKIYYPDLFGGTLSVIPRRCAGLKEKFAFAALVCSVPADRDVSSVISDVARSSACVCAGDIRNALPVAPTYPLRSLAPHGRSTICSHFTRRFRWQISRSVLGFGHWRKRPLVVRWHADICDARGVQAELAHWSR